MLFETIFKISSFLRIKKPITLIKSKAYIVFQNSLALLFRVFLTEPHIVVPNLDFNIKSKCFNDKNVTAHHGIIPTNVDLDLSKLDDKQRNIYTAISNFYISQFLPNLIKEETRAATKILETLD